MLELAQVKTIQTRFMRTIAPEDQPLHVRVVVQLVHDLLVAFAQFEIPRPLYTGDE